MAEAYLKVMCRVLCAKERTGWIAPQLASGLVQWSHDPRVEKWDYDNLIGFETSQLARNKAAEEFLESDCEYLLMIDNDSKPIAPDTHKLLNYVDLAAAGLPIVAAPMPVIKGYDWHLNGYAVQGKAWRPMSVGEIHGKGPSDLAEGLEHQRPVECDAVGFGAVCIRRDVIEGVQYFGHTYTDSQTAVTCEPSVVFRRTRNDSGGTEVGEDLLFCHRARGAGCFCSYMLPHLQSGHLHTMDFGEMHKTKYAYISPVDLGVTGPFPDMDAFTIELSLAKWLKDEIDKGRFKRVLELGSGLSTLVMGHALSKVEDSLLITLEDSEEHWNKLGPMLDGNGLVNVKGELGDYMKGPISSFSIEFEKVNGRSGVDMLLVDGPRVTKDKPYIRACAIHYLHLVTPSGCIVMDDADRMGEAFTIKKWVEEGLVSNDIKRLGRAAILTKI